MYIIKYQQLKLGDIIIDREDTNESRRIRKQTNSDYSHARIYVGDTIMEANGLAVQSINPQRILYNSPSDVVILRHTEANVYELRQACRYARSEFGKEYSITQIENRQFCFRLVAEAYQYAGIDIVNNPTRCSANDFLRSEKLKEVVGMTREANDRDLEIANSEGIMQDKGLYNQQSEIAADMFARVRKYVYDNGEEADIIQNDDQLLNFLIRHPEFDKGIASILKDSPYFTMWKEYEKLNPWEFEVDAFIKKVGEHSRDVAMQLLEKCDGEEPKTWLDMFMAVTDIYYRHGLESAKVYVELYTNLLLLNARRKSVMESVLYDEA